MQRTLMSAARMQRTLCVHCAHAAYTVCPLRNDGHISCLPACCCLQAVARSFGFAVPPRVNLNIESKAAHARKAAKTAAAGADYRRKTGHAFSASNPYGKRAEGDKRQLVRM